MFLRNKIFFLISLLVLFQGCSIFNKSIINPTHSLSSIIGLEVDVEAPIGIFSDIPDVIIFVRCENNYDIKNGTIIESNYIKDNTFYTFNALPGIYYIIGSYKNRLSIKYLTLFNDESIYSTRFEVKSNSIVYLGNYKIKANMGKIENNELHDFFKDNIAINDNHFYINSLKTNSMRFSAGYIYNGKILSIDTTDKVKKDFQIKTMGIINGTEWDKINIVK